MSEARDLLADLDDLSPHGLLNFTEIHDSEEWRLEEEQRIKNFASISISEISSNNPQLKELIRGGIPCKYRRKLWFVISGGMELYRSLGNVWDHISSMAVMPESPKRLLFGCEIDLQSILPEEGARQVTDFLKIILHQNRNLVYAPLVVPVSILLLLFMEPPLAYFTLQAMINNENWYISASREHFNASVFSLSNIGKKHCKKIVKHAESRLKMSLSEMWFLLIPTFFLPHASFAATLTIFDSFMSEGRKIIVRVCVALFKKEKEILKKCTHSRSFEERVNNAIENWNNPTHLHELMRIGFKFQLSRKDMKNCEALYRGSTITSHADAFPLLKSHCYTLPDFRPMVPVCRTENVTYYSPGSRASVIPSGIRIPEAFPRHQITNGSLLTPDLMQKIAEHLPPSVQRCSARAVFRMKTDGTRMTALVQAGRSHGPYIIMVETCKKIVGAFLSDCLRINPRYYGRPNMFVFQIIDSNVTAYKQGTSAPNTKFMSVHHTYEDGIQIFIGHRPAIYLVDRFLRLQSYECDTYGSPSFVENPSGDKILDVELYKLE